MQKEKTRKQENKGAKPHHLKEKHINASIGCSKQQHDQIMGGKTHLKKKFVRSPIHIKNISEHIGRVPH